MGDHNFEVVKEFIYLGILVNATNTIKKEVGRRVMATNRCYYGLSRQLQSRVLFSKTKCNIYEILIKSVLTYGSECWALTKVEKRALLIFERKILKKIYGQNVRMERGEEDTTRNHMRRTGT